MTPERHTRELPADLITPVGAYLRLREALGAPAFLLESVERGEQVGRHSFLAAGLPAVGTLEEAAAFAASQPGPAAGAPPFAGGAVGFGDRPLLRLAASRQQRDASNPQDDEQAQQHGRQDAACVIGGGAAAGSG